MSKNVCEYTTFKTRCLAGSFRPSRNQKRTMRNLNTFLNGGSWSTVETQDLSDSQQMLGKLNEGDSVRMVSFVNPSYVPKRDSEQKARRKRILRRMRKGKPTEKGVLRDKPKNLEFRIKEGLHLTQTTNSLVLEGAVHTLTVEFVDMSARDQVEREIADLYSRYYRQTFGYDELVTDAYGHWNFSLGDMDNFWKFFDGGEKKQVESEVPSSGQYFMLYRLAGKVIMVGIVNVLQMGVYSRAVYYDPNQKHLNLGTYAALVELYCCRKWQKPYFILGDFQYSSPRLRYKTSFKPCELSTGDPTQFVSSDKVLRGICYARLIPKNYNQKRTSMEFQ